MSQKYYVNMDAQSNGDHEVHIAACYWFPGLKNRKYLGEFESCRSAVHEAEKHTTQVNGCKYCCTPCHTQ